MQLNDVFDKKDHGRIIVKIDKLMAKRNITLYALSKSAMIKYHILQRYSNQGEQLQRVDLDVLSRILYALGTSDISEVLEYIPPEK